MEAKIKMKQIDAALLQKMLIGGAKRLESNKEYINELNVFPVPDGDTGTNMTMTALAAAKEVGNAPEVTVKEVTRALSSGSLRGARGNSGVILSQLFRGFYKGVKSEDVLTTETAAAGFKNAVDTAYKAVMKPKEGTILTVAKVTAEKAVACARETEDFNEFAEVVIKEANAILKKTPDMLPVLKEAGVVDSGGQGLVEFLQGAVDVLSGKEVDLSGVERVAKKPAATQTEAPLEEKDIKFGYCTEFIVMTKEEISMEEEQKFKDFLMGIGDSIVVVADEDIIKVHVHTNHPGKAIEKGLTYGELTNMKIDNMREEHRERLNLTQAEAQVDDQPVKPEEPKKDYGFVAVSIGQGMNDIFRELGVDYLIEGGQTMNPSTEDMLNAIEQVNAETVFILPNNKNIILAATQAQSLVEDKNVVIIPTTTVPQGISAIIGFDPEADVESNEESMKDIIECVKTGEVTYAVRDTSINGIAIKIDDIMGIDDDGIKKVGQDIEKVTLGLLEEMVDEDSELISIYYGADTTKEQAEALLEKVEETYGDCDVQLEYGGQPIYYFLLSVE
ncbi:DAK2 domain-containing protein [Anaerostipes hadrus]|uniref:DAK2 domain-containing protein n=1 Tax=Anaerostipes hadrus TaxID=649756 RepID=UPI001C00EF1E|nr:DAK2 domain-containing protein [Anaerostipes hadrus]MBT9902712.1 DAK2 domain-containing protein [Anaerostipes hadrus]